MIPFKTYLTANDFTYDNFLGVDSIDLPLQMRKALQVYQTCRIIKGGDVMMEETAKNAAISSYVWGALATQYPKEAVVASRVADKTIDVMERNARKLPAFSITDICYWVKLATYAHMIVDGIREQWDKMEKMEEQMAKK